MIIKSSMSPKIILHYVQAISFCVLQNLHNTFFSYALTHLDRMKYWEELARKEVVFIWFSKGLRSLIL